MLFRRRLDSLLLRHVALASCLLGWPVVGQASTKPDAAVEQEELAVPPLCDAAYRGDLREVRRLLRNGAAVDAAVSDGTTALMMSLRPYIGLPAPSMAAPSEKARREYLERRARKIQIAQLLLASGADAKKAGQGGVTALHLAAGAVGEETGMLPIARELLRRGAPVDALTIERTTPLWLAIAKQRFAIAKVLVAAGANLHAPDSGGQTPADLLVQQGRQALLERLRKSVPPQPR